MTNIARLSRSVQIKVTLTPDLDAQLRELARQLGQAPATVASVAVGEYVRTKVMQAAQFQHIAQSATALIQTMVEEQMPEQLRLAEAAVTGSEGPPQAPPKKVMRKRAK